MLQRSSLLSHSIPGALFVSGINVSGRRESNETQTRLNSGLPQKIRQFASLHCPITDEADPRRDRNECYCAEAAVKDGHEGDVRVRVLDLVDLCGCVPLVRSRRPCNLNRCETSDSGSFKFIELTGTGSVVLGEEAADYQKIGEL